MASNFPTKWDIVLADASTAAQTMHQTADAVLTVLQLAGGETSTAGKSLSVVSGAPAAGEAQFAGNPGSPSATLTLNADPAAGTLFFIEYIPQGTIPHA